MKKLIRIFGYAKPYWGRLLLGILCVLTVAGTGLVMPKIIQFVLDDVLRKPFISIKLFGLSLSFSNKEWLFIILATIMILYVFRGAVSFARTYLISWVGQRILFDMRNHVFQHLQNLSMQFYETRGTGHIMARITGDIDTMGGLITGTTIDLVTQFFMLVMIVYILVSWHWKLALLSFSVLPLYVLNSKFFVGMIKGYWRLLREKWSELYGDLYESIAGAKVVKAHSMEKHEIRMIFREMRESYTYNIRLARLYTLMGNIAELITVSGTALILFYGGLEVLRGHLTPGALIAFYSYLGGLYGPIMTLVNMNQTIQTTLVSADRVFEILDTKPTVEDAPDAIPLPPIKGHVKVEDVYFSYDPEKPVLKGISFEVPPGTMVALVGPSGSGKTTLAHLIARFYDPTSGAIYIDGYDIKKVTLKSLRDQIGIVLQESFLFSGSIKDNIKYGNPKATDEEVVRAAIAANAHQFIVERLPEGYDTQIGGEGITLSGGERQRICIARAILRNPRILILDEATSSLDSEAEALIQEALEKLLVGRTSFVIAHRLSTVMKADIIIVMNEGRIEEMGTHEELLQRDGLYRRLYMKQFRIEEDILEFAR
jgi:ABC-type multidrug transport system fused ATPase/permease subunit